MGLLTIASLFAFGERAQAQEVRRVVVERFTGVQSARVRASLVANLEAEGAIDLIDDEVVEAARRSAALEGRTDEAAYVELGRLVDAHAFVEGTVSRRRRQWTATLRVRSAADGTIVGTARFGGRTVTSLSAVRRQGYRRLRSGFDRAQAAPRPVAAPPQEGWWTRRDETPAPAEPEPEAPEPTARERRYDAFVFALTGGTLYRFMSTGVSVYAAQRGLSPADPASTFRDEERSYNSAGIGHFEPGFRLELFPGAFVDPQPFPYLGVVFAFRHSAFLVSNGFDRETGQAVAVGSDQLDLVAALRFRYRFGEHRREPELHFDLGYALFRFDLDLDALRRLERDTIIPPMQHGSVYVGAGLTYGLVPDYLSVGVDVAYRIGAHRGDDMAAVWGVDTGPGHGLTVGLELKLEIPEADGIFFALRAEYFQFTTDFSGQVACAEPAGCEAFIEPWDDRRMWEPWPVTPGGSIRDDVIGGPDGPVNDNYFRLQLQLGWAFR